MKHPRTSEMGSRGLCSLRRDWLQSSPSHPEPRAAEARGLQTQRQPGQPQQDCIKMKTSGHGDRHLHWQAEHGDQEFKARLDFMSPSQDKNK